MKKTIIGAIFMICGTIIDVGILVAASIYATTLNSWVGSKLWYSIFGVATYGNEANLSLNLGVPFIFGAIIILLGLIILISELVIKKSKV